jgi:hypothetical protein
MKNLTPILAMIILLIAPKLQADQYEEPDALSTEFVQQTVADYWSETGSAPEDGWPAMDEGQYQPNSWDADLAQLSMDEYLEWAATNYPDKEEELLYTIAEWQMSTFGYHTNETEPGFTEEEYWEENSAEYEPYELEGPYGMGPEYENWFENEPVSLEPNENKPSCICEEKPESCSFIIKKSFDQFDVRAKEDLKQVIAKVKVHVTLISTEGNTKGCHITQGAYVELVFTDLVDGHLKQRYGELFAANELSIHDRTVTIDRPLDYDGSETRVNKDGNAVINDSPKTNQSRRDGGPILFHTEFAATNQCKESPEIQAAWGYGADVFWAPILKESKIDWWFWKDDRDGMKLEKGVNMSR